MKGKKYMEKEYIERLVETEQRSKSNMKRLDEYDIRFKEVDSKLEDIKNTEKYKNAEDI